MYKKGIVLAIICLFVGAGVIPNVIGNNSIFLDEVWVDAKYYEGGHNDGHTWGIDAFANIQDGIDAVAISGTVHVNNGTYYENVIVDKSINLIGENRDETFINASGSGDTVKIEDPGGVNITGFNIQNSGKEYAGIHIFGSGNHIFKNNIAYNKNVGIKIEGNGDNRIGFNSITKNGREGILIYEFKRGAIIENNEIIDNGHDALGAGDGNCIRASNNVTNIKIYNNTIKKSFHDGIHLNYMCQTIDIFNNTIIGILGIENSGGIYLDKTKNVICTKNNISNYTYGICTYRLRENTGNKIYLNTIDGNNINIEFRESIFSYGTREDQTNILTDNNIVNAKEYAITTRFVSFVWAWSNWWGSELKGPNQVVGTNRANRLNLGVCIAFPWSTEKYDLSRDY